MPVITETFTLKTAGKNDVLDITRQVAMAVQSSGCNAGTAVVFVPGSTAGVTTIEFEPGAVSDLKEAISRLAPEGMHYAHDARWGDGNGYSHVRAALVGASLAVPFAGKSLMLGTWQQIVLVDCDNRPRSREIIVQVCGE